MRHKNMTMITILRTTLVGSLALFLNACDSGGSETAPSDGNAADDVASSASADDAAAPDAAASGKTLVTVHRDANGVPTGEITVGNPEALEMIEYASLTCSHCAAHHINVWPEIKKTYVDTGKLKMTFRLFARSALDEIVSLVPLCAADEQVYPIIDLMLARQDRWLHGENGQVVLDNLAALVRRTGMSRATFDSCVRDQALLKNIRAIRDFGLKEDRINATPTFVLDGEKFNSADYATFVEKIEDAL